MNRLEKEQPLTRIEANSGFDPQQSESLEREQKWVTVAEAAEAVGYSQGYIRDLISRDRIPSKKLEVEVKRTIGKRFVDLEALRKVKRMAKRGRPPKEPTSQVIRYTPLEIDITLEQIPDNDPCELCGEPAMKTLIEYELPYTCEGESFVAWSEVPGYRCETCNLEFYDLGASIEVLEVARKVVQEANDETTLERIEASLNAGKQHRAKFS